MSETLQSNRIQNARSLARLQAHGHSSQGYNNSSQIYGHSSQAHGHSFQAHDQARDHPSSASQAHSHSTKVPGHSSQIHTHSSQIDAHSSEIHDHSSSEAPEYPSSSPSSIPVSSPSPSVVSPSTSLVVDQVHETATAGSTVSSATVKKKHRLRLGTGSSNRFKLLHSSKWPKLRNIDRAHMIRSQEITVDNVTVTITEYPLLYPDSD